MAGWYYRAAPVICEAVFLFAFRSLASGSSGNAYLLRTGKTILLFEAGLRLPVLQKYLAAEDVALHRLSAVLISHEHRDHCLAARELRSFAASFVGGTSMRTSWPTFPPMPATSFRIATGGRSAGVLPRADLRPGARAAPVIRWWMRRCVNYAARAGCITGLGSSLARF